PQMLGITLAFGLMAAAAGLGLAGLVHAEPHLHQALKFAGAAYLLFLAWRIAHAGAGGGANARTRPIGFLEAAPFTWMNVKAWVSALGALATYTTANGDALTETALIAGVLAAFCLISSVLWAGFGAGIGRLLANRRARMVFNWSMAGLLALSLV